MSPSAGAADPHSHDSWLVRICSGAAADVRHGTRRLLREKGFAAVALLTLALCIGANTAIFSMIYALVLKPLPYPQPTRIVEIYNSFPKGGFDKFPCNVVQYSDFKANTTAFDSIGLCQTNLVMLGKEGSAERTVELDLTAEIFDVLGVKPLIGQFYTLKNSRVGEDKVVVLTESFWKSHFNEDPGVLDKPMTIDGETCLIVGVGPHSMEALDAQAKFYRPISWKPEDINPGGRYGCRPSIYARLKPGVTPAEALGQVAGLEQNAYDKAPPGLKNFLDATGHKIRLGLLQAERVQPIKASLYLLQGGVLFVLLIGCVNVANLLLTRANAQQSELAVRAALGASRGAIARQLLIESLLLTLAGAVLGIGLAYGAVAAINHFTARLMPNMLPVAIDGGILAYAVVIAVAVGLLIGLLPVVHILRSNLAALIHRSSRSTSGGRGVRALSSVLVMGQVAVALVLLTGAGLLIHSFANAISVNPGFDPSNLVVGSIALPSSYQTKERNADFQKRLEAALREIPGADGVALSTGIPFQGNLPINALTLKENALPKDAPQPAAFLVGVSLGYFQALHIQLLEGRFLEESDFANGRKAYIVDERFAKNLFPGRSAVGGHFTFGAPPAKDSDWPVIVGVVRNVPHNGVEDRSNNPFVYYPLLNSSAGGFSLFVRTSRPLGDAVTAIREKLRSVDPAVPLFETGTVQKAIDDSFDNRRAVMLLLGGFAVLALFLSAIGIYGVLAYDVSQRTREIGIRGAIGATRPQIVGLIMRQGLWKTGVGLVAGLVGAILLSHYLTSMLFELKSTDPWSYVIVALVLAAVAALASYLPARHAARINPNEALRTD
ncbi:MAG TPA: ABC transporter permease [Opitutaceae bacterium]